MKNAKQLREERDAKLTAARALTDAAKAAKRELSADEATQFDAFMDEAETMATDITRAVRAESAAAEQAGKTPPLNSHNTTEARDLSDYSLLKAVRSIMPGGAPLEGIEKEMHQQAVSEARAAGESVQGVGIPQMLLSKRDNSVTMPTQPQDGGSLVEKNLRPVIDLLRPRSVLRELGAQFLTGLTGVIGVPTMASGAVSTWKPEVGELDKSNQTFSDAEMKPKRLGTYAIRSKQFLIQTAPSVEAMLRQDLENSIIEALEIAAINGLGTANQPLGILNTAGIGSVVGGANGGAITRSTLIALAAAVEAQNVRLTNPGYLINVPTKAKLMDTRTDAGSGLFVLDSLDTLMGYKYATTQEVPSNLVKGTGTGLSAAIFGNWSDLLVGQWGGLDLTVDPYTLATNGQIRIIIQSFFDVLVQRPKAFAAIKDIITA